LASLETKKGGKKPLQRAQADVEEKNPGKVAQFMGNLESLKEALKP